MLTINKTLLANSIGYFSVYINTIQNMINILNDVNSSAEDKVNAENMINNEILKFNKMVNVIIQKGKYKPVIEKYSDLELTNMGIL
jgi:hypothetical protein